MKELTTLLENLGCSDVKTYIQSGNAVFTTPENDWSALGEQIGSAIEERYGFRPRTLVLSLEDFERAINRNPYQDAVDDPKSLHLYFLAEGSEDPDLDVLQELRANDERFTLDDRVFYLHAPAGIGRSKLAERVERALGVPVTARNWRTVTKILEMARGL